MDQGAENEEPIPFEFNYITDGIYIGTNQCCQTHFDERLKREGITADVSLEEDRLDAPFGVEFYLWLPVKDHTPPTPAQLELGVDFLEKLVGLGKKIYVHCRRGHGRAPTLVAAYLIKKGNIPEEAEKLIKAQRPSIHLQPSQKQALEAFFQEFKK
jgi:protein-tyrosine phosphatase